MVGVTEKETKDRVIRGPTTLGDLRREQPKTEKMRKNVLLRLVVVIFGPQIAHTSLV